MFLFAMILNPDVQRRAQEEIDSVVGRGRTPTFADRPRLPYVEALLRELFRWRPVLPLAIPHRGNEVRHNTGIREQAYRDLSLLIGRCIRELLHS